MKIFLCKSLFFFRVKGDQSFSYVLARSLRKETLIIDFDIGFPLWFKSSGPNCTKKKIFGTKKTLQDQSQHLRCRIGSFLC